MKYRLPDPEKLRPKTLAGFARQVQLATYTHNGPEEAVVVDPDNEVNLEDFWAQVKESLTTFDLDPVEDDETSGLELPVDTAAEDRAKAHAAIVQALAENGVTDVGYPCFYLPSEWVRKGNTFGSQSLLIVVHDGNPLAPFFNPSYNNRKLMREMSRALEKAGFWVELCTSTYSAIYKEN